MKPKPSRSHPHPPPTSAEPAVAGDPAVLAAEARAVVAELGLDLIELAILPAGGDWRLQMAIDRLPGRGGITLAECEKVSRALMARLDGPPVLASNYELEVSSPGIDRLLRDAADLQRFAGMTAKIKWRDANGARTDIGVLSGVTGEPALVQLSVARGKGKGQELLGIELAAIVRAQLAPTDAEWMALGQKLAAECPIISEVSSDTADPSEELGHTAQA